MPLARIMGFVNNHFLILVQVFIHGMLTSEDILNTLSEKRERIQRYGVRKIGLFGSFSSNTQGRKSDIDILVEFKRGQKTFDNYMDLKFFLESVFGRRVDLVVKEALKTEVKPSILKGVRYASGI